MTFSKNFRRYALSASKGGGIMEDKCLVAAKARIVEAERLLKRVTWRSKIHLSGCGCPECNAVDTFLTTIIEKLAVT
jgi:hypothetical protein